MGLKHLQPETEAPKVRRSKRWLLLLLPLILLLAGEGLARAFGPGKAEPSEAGGVLTRDESGLRTLIPNSSYDAGTGRIEINQLGLRGELPDSSRIKIAIVGGDAVFGGRFANTVETIPGFLETQLTLNRLSNRFQVINAGMPGMNLPAARSVVIGKLLEAEVDAIVLMLGHDQMATIAEAAQLDGEAAMISHSEPPTPSAMSNSALWRLLFERSDRPVGIKAQKDSNTDPQAVRVEFAKFASELRKLVKECRAAGIGVVLATEPSVVTSESQELLTKRLDYAARKGLDLGTATRLLADLRAVMGALAGFDDGIWFLDVAKEVATEEDRRTEMREPVPGEAKLYAEDRVLGPGLTKAGIERAARALDRFLISAKPWAQKRAAMTASSRAVGY